MSKKMMQYNGIEDMEDQYLLRLTWRNVYVKNVTVFKITINIPSSSHVLLCVWLIMANIAVEGYSTKLNWRIVGIMLKKAVKLLSDHQATIDTINAVVLL